MPLTDKLARFIRKPLAEKRGAIRATIVSLSPPLLRGLAKTGGPRNWLRHAKAEGIQFNSGLGDTALVLYALTRALKPAICVEIGSARGKSACFIGMALKENGRGRVFAIDPHSCTDWTDADSIDSFGIFRANIAALGLQQQITILRSTSEAAAQNWDRPIDLLFIDGDHTYDGVKRDWDLFARHVSPFGVVIFHDTMYRDDVAAARPDAGVPRFVDELRGRGYPTLTIHQEYGMTLVQPVIGGCHLLPSSDLVDQA